MKKLLLPFLIFISSFLYAQDTLVLQNISVSGVRADVKTPISQKTLTKKDIDKIYQGQEMTYMLSNTPSVTYQSDGGQPNGYTTFRLRGIDQTRVNMTMNGVQLSESEDQGVYFSNYPDFATNIQSLQIQRGVGTSSNGVSSFGGSINFESQNGLEKGGLAQLGYGSFNTSHFNISNSTGLSKKHLALFTSLSAYNTDGYKYHSSGKGYSGFISGGYYGKSDIIKFTGFTGRALNGMAWYAVSEDDINKDPRTNDNPKGENDDFKQSFGQLQYIKAFNSNSYLSTTIFYNRLDGTWSMFLDPTNPIDLLHYNLHSNFYGIISNYHVELKNLKFDMGVEGNKYDRNHSAIVPSQSSNNLYDNTGFKRQFSGFTKLSYQLNKFTLFGDIQARFVDFKYQGDVKIPTLNWNFINPKGGITYTVDSDLNYYVSVGSSHREPTRTDMFGGNDNLIELGNTKAESVIDYEVGTNLKHDNLKIQANFYYMDFKNEITLLGALGSNGLPLMTNVKKSYRSGFEIDLNYKINNHFNIINNSNFSRNRIIGDANNYQPLYTPTVIINQGIEYNTKSLIFGLLGKYQNKSYISFDNDYSTPEFLILNANISYKYNNYTIMLQGNNLTNCKYFTNGYVIDNEKYYFVNAPASIYLTAKVNF